VSRKAAPEPESVRGEASDTIRPVRVRVRTMTSRPHPFRSPSPPRSARLERSCGACAGRRLADHERVDLYALRSGLGLAARLRPGHSSSSSVSGVVRMSLLEQALMLVGEGVGERVRGDDVGR
jgi:hypothetical protein